MKVTAATALLAAGVTASHHNSGRAVTTITGLLEAVFGAMSNADNHVLQFEGGDVSALVQASANLMSVIGQNIEAAKNMEPLTPEDIIAIAPLSQEVSEVGAKFLQDLGDAAPKFQASGHCSHVRNFAAHLGAVSNELFSAAKEKFPAGSQDYANKEIEETNARFVAAEAALSPPCCNDGPPGEGEGPNPGGEPSTTTSVAWHTGPGFPGMPTAPPKGELPGNNGNGTHPGKPSPPPVTGSGHVLAFSSAGLALVMGVALFL
ncbi:hypothetical protein F5Y09DRAFT_336739 [Xylaria sp. FL1042]|nr:hypothetical protein F5Y09DRAFT_336704 [Xylaria sp. FL1042]KAI0435364.1 hypothetical protein F5Y09DRAFT_336739 [Xylaria sp. FL1042]